MTGKENDLDGELLRIIYYNPRIPTAELPKLLPKYPKDKIFKSLEKLRKYNVIHPLAARWGS